MNYREKDIQEILSKNKVFVESQKQSKAKELTFDVFLEYLQKLRRDGVPETDWLIYQGENKFPSHLSIHACDGLIERYLGQLQDDPAELHDAYLEWVKLEKHPYEKSRDAIVTAGDCMAAAIV